MELLFNKREKSRDAEDLGEKPKFDFGHRKFEVLFRHLRRLDIEAWSSEQHTEVLRCVKISKIYGAPGSVS